MEANSSLLQPTVAQPAGQGAEQPTETLGLTSVGEVGEGTVTHMDQPMTSEGLAVCCFPTPPAPGRYMLVVRARVASGTEFTYNYAYTVKPPQ